MNHFVIFLFVYLLYGFSKTYALGLLETLTQEPAVKCFDNRDCPEEEYCYQVSGTCVRCFNCAKYLRKNTIRCAKRYQDCGACMPNAVLFLKQGEYWCKQDSVAQPHTREWDFTTEVYSIGPLVCVIFLVGAAFYCFRTRNRMPIIVPDVETNSECNSATAYQNLGLGPPPAYSEEETFELQVFGASFQNGMNKAVPFLLNASQGHCPSNWCVNEPNTGNPANIENNPSIEAATGIALVSDSPPPSSMNVDIHDETTCPSSWTPGPLHNSDPATGCGGPPAKKKKKNSEQ